MILYFDVSSIMISNRYVANNPDVARAKDQWIRAGSNELLMRVRLDPESISTLTDFCRGSGVKMFPLGTLYSRKFLIAQGIEPCVLAQEVSIHRRMDDSSEIRRILSHVAAIGADDWIVIGDINPESLTPSFIENHIDSVFGEGVTPELVSKLYERMNHKI